VPEADIWHEETNAWDMRILTADGQTTRTEWPQSFLLRGSLLPHSDTISGA